MAKQILGQKTGNGAFYVALDGAKFLVSIEGSEPRAFMSARHAYDWCVSSYSELTGTMRGYSYLNAAEALEESL